MVDAINSLPGLNLAAALKQFLARPHEVRLEIVVASPTDLTQQLITGELHVAIAPFKNMAADLTYTEICREEHRLYCSASHPLFDLPDAEITADLITTYPTCQRSYDLQVTTDLPPPPSPATVANMEAMAMLIETGHYLGALPVHVAETWVQTGKFRELNGEHLSWMSTFHLATRRIQVQRRAVELFIRDVTEVCGVPA